MADDTAAAAAGEDSDVAEDVVDSTAEAVDVVEDHHEDH